MHPVKLPCAHIFCFLCVKGVAIQSKRCALCRTEIPPEYFNNPILVTQDDLLKDASFEDGSWWFYEGRNGWWKYDERTSIEIEERYKQGTKSFELLIAGFLYVLDLDNMVQYRRNDPFRRRRVKRDLISIPKKGVAGLKITSPVLERSSGDGGERGGQRATQRIIQQAPVVVDNNDNSSSNTRTVTPPIIPPTNTPQSTAGSGQTSPDQELVAQMSQLSVNQHIPDCSSTPTTHYQHDDQTEYTDSSDDDDWS